MKFSNTYWLWFLLLVPAIFFVVSYQIQLAERQLGLFIKSSLWKKLIPELRQGARKRKLTLWSLAFSCFIIALARPMGNPKEETVTTTGVDLLIGLDLSNSMEVEDAVPNRLKKSKHFIRSLLDLLQGDRVGIVGFAGSAFLLCPLTNDLDYVREVLDTLSPQSIPFQGTDVGLALHTAREAIERGAQGPGASPSEDYASKAVLLISDGEDLQEKGKEGAIALKEKDIRLFVVGVGTEKGGLIPIRDEMGELRGYKRDQSGTAVVSTFNGNSLREMAQSAGGRYWDMSTSESEINEILGQLGTLHNSSQQERKQIVYEERFYIPLLLGLFLIILEMSFSITSANTSTIRQTTGRALLHALIPLFSLIEHSSANESPSLNTYLHNKNGLKALEKKNLSEAKKEFGSAQALQPSIPELKFNQGVFHLQQQEWDPAIQAFQDTSKMAKSQSLPGLEEQSYYNLATAYEKSNKPIDALQSLLKVLDLTKLTGNADLENLTRQRIEQMVKQQQQKAKGQGQGQGGGDQEKKDEQKKEDQANNKEENKDQKDKKFQNPKKDSFKAEKLSKDDADRVMEELSNRERELQSRLRRKMKRDQAELGKDW